MSGVIKKVNDQPLEPPSREELDLGKALRRKVRQLTLLNETRPAKKRVPLAGHRRRSPPLAPSAPRDRRLDQKKKPQARGRAPKATRQSALERLRRVVVGQNALERLRQAGVDQSNQRYETRKGASQLSRGAGGRLNPALRSLLNHLRRIQVGVRPVS